MASALLFVSAQCLAQTEVTVPPSGYEGTDTLLASNPVKFYTVTVPAGDELKFSFEVIGEGNITVFLSRTEDPLNYFAMFSSPQPVTEFSGTFPADYGFDREYFLQVNSTAQIDVDYRVGIHTQPASEENYTLYYTLIVLGFVALVVFSYKLVVWQERKEREAGKGKRRERRRR